MAKYLAKYLIVIPVLGLMAAAIWYAIGPSDPVDAAPMPTIGYVAMALGIVFSLAVGCGLMALLFYSNRHGYDDQAGMPDDRD